MSKPWRDVPGWGGDWIKSPWGQIMYKFSARDKSLPWNLDMCGFGREFKGWYATKEEALIKHDECLKEWRLDIERNP